MPPRALRICWISREEAELEDFSSDSNRPLEKQRQFRPHKMWGHAKPDGLRYEIGTRQYILQMTMWSVDSNNFGRTFPYSTCNTNYN